MISNEQIAHDLAIAFVSAKMAKKTNLTTSSDDYLDYKRAFDNYKAQIKSIDQAIQNRQRMTELD